MSKDCDPPCGLDNTQGGREDRRCHATQNVQQKSEHLFRIKLVHDCGAKNHEWVDLMLGRTRIMYQKRATPRAGRRRTPLKILKVGAQPSVF